MSELKNKEILQAVNDLIVLENTVKDSIPVKYSGLSWIGGQWFYVSFDQQKSILKEVIKIKNNLRDYLKNDR